MTKQQQTKKKEHARILAKWLEEEGITQQELANLMQVSQANVQHWLAGRQAINPWRAIDLERVSNGKITRQQLNPELYK